MRKLVFISGALSFSLLSIGIVAKSFHLNGGSLILLLATILFALVFVPCAAIYYYKRGGNKKSKDN